MMPLQLRTHTGEGLSMVAHRCIFARLYLFLVGPAHVRQDPHATRRIRLDIAHAGGLDGQAGGRWFANALVHSTHVPCRRWATLPVCGRPQQRSIPCRSLLLLVLVRLLQGLRISAPHLVSYSSRVTYCWLSFRPSIACSSRVLSPTALQKTEVGVPHARKHPRSLAKIESHVWLSGIPLDLWSFTKI